MEYCTMQTILAIQYPCHNHVLLLYHTLVSLIGPIAETEEKEEEKGGGGAIRPAQNPTGAATISSLLKSIQS